ncbi:MAG: hypothetical protein AAF485_16080, partial [Chloroflexota bacterium]
EAAVGFNDGTRALFGDITDEDEERIHATLQLIGLTVIGKLSGANIGCSSCLTVFWPTLSI